MQTVMSQQARGALEGGRWHRHLCCDAVGWGFLPLAFGSWLGQTPWELYSYTLTAFQRV